jgi:hypothetical protein
MLTAAPADASHADHDYVVLHAVFSHAVLKFGMTAYLERVEKIRP